MTDGRFRKRKNPATQTFALTVKTGETTIRKSLQIVIFGDSPSPYFCKKSKQLIGMKTVFKLILMAIAYLVIFILGAASGAIHPACYAYIGALLPLLSAFVYLTTATTIRSFGAAILLNGFILVLFLIAGEADTTFIIGIVTLTALAELIRYCCKYDTLKGIRWSFVPFALSFFAYTLHWWTDTEGSLAAAVEEMRPGYDELMKPVIDNIPMLIVVIALTIPIAMFAMRLAERAMKNQAATLN